MAHFAARRFDEAAAVLRVGLQHYPEHPGILRHLAASYAHLGRTEEARKMIERLRAITPMIEPPAAAKRNSEHRILLVSGLRLAAAGHDASGSPNGTSTSGGIR
jgi:TolA-binding protein